MKFKRFEVGAIIADSDEKKEIIKEFKKVKLTVIKIDTRHDDLILRELIDSLALNKMIIFNVESEFDFKVLDQLKNIELQQLNVTLSGDTEPTVINPLPAGALIIVCDQVVFDRQLQGLVDTVCVI